jgi:protein SCO1/2
MRGKKSDPHVWSFPVARATRQQLACEQHVTPQEIRLAGLSQALKLLVVAAAAIVLTRAAAHEAAAHSHHQRPAPETTRSIVDYLVPDVKLVRDDGQTVELKDELGDARPVVLNFIYTTCTSVCPLTSRTFADLQERLAAARTTVHLVSISIDPEHDTPSRLREYAAKFGAGPQWQHYTGTVAASIAAQRAFNAYRGGKMNHAPVTLVRTAPGNRWIRIDGVASADQLLGELRNAVAAR